MRHTLCLESCVLSYMRTKIQEEEAMSKVKSEMIDRERKTEAQKVYITL